MDHQINSNDELEANEFAMELLMPSEWLLRDCKRIGLFDTKAISKLAKKYRVSNEILVYRMGQLQDRKSKQ